MKKEISIAAITIFALASGFYFYKNSALAHGVGKSLEKEVGAYVIDIGYGVDDAIMAGEAVRFDFNILAGDRSKIAPFSSVWAKITDGEQKIVFSGYLGQPEFGPLGMSFSFPKAGAYELTAKFINEDKTLAEASFPLTAEAGETPEKGSRFSENAPAWGILGLLIGATVAFYAVKAQKS